MYKKTAFIIALLLVNTVNLLAHALWIQTETTGKIGQKQTIKIIYAESGEKPEKVADWYSDVKEFELWLIHPDKQKTKLNASPGEDYYSAEFIPQQEGVYTLSTSHNAKELGGTTVYQFNSSALVKVGKALAGNEAAFNGNQLSVFTDASKANKINQPLKVQVLFKNEAPANMEITIVSPTGWSKKMSTDEKGDASFTPLWPGTYFVEASKSWKEEGTHHDKAYTSYWRCATTLIEVVK